MIGRSNYELGNIVDNGWTEKKFSIVEQDQFEGGGEGDEGFHNRREKYISSS